MRRLWILMITFPIFYGWAQQEKLPESRTLELSPFYGSILLHNPDISHLITAHPSGVILGFNRQTFGSERWQQYYNYPDTGISLVYQDMKNSTLGHNIGLYAHYNFYFFRRNVQLRIGQGIAYNTNPYDKNDNFRGNSYGSHLMSTTLLMLNYKKENIFENFGLKAGISIVHYSNANVKAPNTSTNTFALNAGLVYSLDGPDEGFTFQRDTSDLVYDKTIRTHLVFRSGINESDVINSGQFPFYIFSAYASKRVSNKSAILAGADVFFSNFLRELIRFKAISFPEENVDPDSDYKRLGVFLGHELYIDRLSIITQLGYYVYYPFDFEGRVYNRIGLKRYFGEKWFGAVTLKSHAAKAEALELGIGIRL